jgi:hypothetical protein
VRTKAIKERGGIKDGADPLAQKQAARSTGLAKIGIGETPTERTTRISHKNTITPPVVLVDFLSLNGIDFYFVDSIKQRILPSERAEQAPSKRQNRKMAQK